MNALDEFSVQTALLVEEDFPDWRGAGGPYQFEDYPPYWLLEVSPPSPRFPGPLRIDTANNEVTVAFGDTHSHFQRWRPIAGDSRHKSALLAVRSFLNEKVASVAWLIDDFVKASGSLEKGQRIRQAFRIPAINKVRIRSWAGTLDLDCTVAEANKRKLVL